MVTNFEQNSHHSYNTMAIYISLQHSCFYMMWSSSIEPSPHCWLTVLWCCSLLHHQTYVHCNPDFVEPQWKKKSTASTVHDQHVFPTITISPDGRRVFIKRHLIKFSQIQLTNNTSGSLFAQGWLMLHGNEYTQRKTVVVFFSHFYVLNW